MIYISSITKRAKEKIKFLIDSEDIKEPVFSFFLADIQIEKNYEKNVIIENRINFGIFENHDFNDEDLFDIGGIKFLKNGEISEYLKERNVLDIDKQEIFYFKN